MRVGALVIGSLFWERQRWSPNVVDFDAARDVPARIRYGRISESRGLAYTMIVSPEAPTGNAKAVPFQRAVTTFAGVVDAASELASAEGLPRSTLSSGWGCVGLLGITANAAAFVERWREHMRSRATRVCAGYAESPPMDANAVITAGLSPGHFAGFDLLLVTVTTPTPPLPIVERVVDAMGVSDGASKGLHYFRENVRHGISTFQDDAIAAALRARGISI